MPAANAALFRKRAPKPCSAVRAVFIAQCALLVASLSLTRTAAGQVAPAAERSGINLFAGFAPSAYKLQYGQRQMLGLTAWVDVDSTGLLGLEGEARWLVFHQTAQVTAATWLAGPRYRRKLGKFEIYGKGLAGIGEFNFPYRYAYGRYLVVAPGGGVDLHLSGRIRLRLVDAEYQYWPQFTFGPTSSAGISAGVCMRVF